MENGDSLSPSGALEEEYTKGLVNEDAAIILPKPENEDLYKVIHFAGTRTEPYLNSYYHTERTYHSTVDLSKNNGLGKVVEKNQVLLEESVQPYALNAIRHGNGRDWWIPIRHKSEPIFHVFLLDPSGLSLHHTDTLSEIPDNYIHDMRVFKNGDQLIYLSTDCILSSCFQDQWSEVLLYTLNFDRCNGEVTFKQMYDFQIYNVWPTSIELCKNDRLLYMSDLYYLYQFDLYAEDFSSSVDTLAERIDPQEERFMSLFKTRTTPRQELMVSSIQGNFISMVHNPELRGEESNSRPFSLEVPQRHWSLPNFPNFRLGPIDGSPCDTLGIDNLPKAWFRYNDMNLEEYERRFTDLSYFRPETWHWDFDDGTTFDGQEPGIHEFPGQGEYYVCLTVSNENAEDTYCEWVIIDGPSSVEEELEERGYSIYPNPTRGAITLELNQVISAPSELRIYDMRAALLRTFHLDGGQDRFDFDLRGLASGMYVIEWKSGEDVFVERVVVE